MVLEADEFTRELDELATEDVNQEVLDAIRILKTYSSEKGSKALRGQFEKALGREGDTFLTALSQELAELSGLIPSKEKKSLRKIWDKTMGRVWQGAKDHMLSKDGFQILGATLSAPGKVLEGVSEFWDEAQKQHPLLKYADKPVKAFAVALYIEGAPIIGAIKAAELVGRTAEEYGKTRKFWPSLKKASREWAEGIYHHFLRLTIGESIKPAMEQFYKTLGVREKDAKRFIEVVQAYDQMGSLDNLGKEAAELAAERVSNLASDLVKTHPVLSTVKEAALDLGLLASIILPATAKDVSYNQIKEVVGAVLDPAISEQVSKLSPRVKSFAMERIIQAVRDNPNQDVSKLVSDSVNALASAKGVKINVNMFELHLKKHNPDLHKKLGPFFEVGNGKKVGFEEVESLMKSSKQLKKLNKFEKQDLMKFVSDYVVEDVLSSHLGASAAREVKESKTIPPVKKGFASRFKRSKGKVSKATGKTSDKKPKKTFASMFRRKKLSEVKLVQDPSLK